MHQHIPSTPIQLHKPKRKHGSENVDPNSSSLNPTPPKRRKYSTRQSHADKLALIFSALSDAHWTLGYFLFHVFRFKDDDSQAGHQNHAHATYVQHFLHGHTHYTPATILDLWFHHPDGRDARTAEMEPMYCLTIPFIELKYIHPALTAFAAQTVRQQLIREADEAIKPENGLHAYGRIKPQTQTQKPDAKKRIEWTDIGSATVPHVAKILQKYQPLTWAYLFALAEHIPRKRRDEEIASRTTCRPPHVVVHALASLDFARSNRANLLPLAQGLLYFSLSAMYDLFLYNSRKGTTPAYSTVYHTMEDLAAHEATVVKALGRDRTKFGTIFLDNVQNYLSQRDLRVGRENTLNIGIAATYVEAPRVDPKAFDLKDKQRRKEENRQEGLTVPMLLQFIDQTHRETMGVLQWLCVLTHYMPELAKHQSHVTMLYQTRGAKQRLPAEASKVHPLAASGKNETITTELKDVMVNFLAQLGQTPDDFLPSIQITGGDGLTYEKLTTLKNYLQFHDNDFERASIIEPAWCCGIWVGQITMKISRGTPSNLKKVEYNSGTEMTYLVLDIQMLDCWRVHFEQSNLFDYFKDLTSHNELPEFEDLERIARKLHRAYSSVCAAESALLPMDVSCPDLSPWEQTVPLGSPWVPPVISESSTAGVAGKGLAVAKMKLQGQKKKGKSTVKEPEGPAPPEPFMGDRVLFQSIVFMCNALLSCEFTYAMAEGDVGRVYEALKVMLFTFAGSTHTKYTTYLLETISNLELECSPELRSALLNSLLVNLSGRPGHFMAGDLMQEHFNRLLQAIAECKGTEYGAHFVHEVVSRNLHHLSRLQNDLKEGVGLSQRSGHHHDPHTRTEVQILSHEYKEHELHYRQPGRKFPLERPNSNDYCHGLTHLRSGKLQHFIHDTIHLRGGLLTTPDILTPASDSFASTSTDPFLNTDVDEQDEETPLAHANLPLVCMVDGLLVIDPVDLDADILKILAELDKSGRAVTESDDEEEEVHEGWCIDSEDT